MITKTSIATKQKMMLINTTTKARTPIMMNLQGSWVAMPTPFTADNKVDFNGVELHKNTCSISCGANDVKLSLKEYQIMELLMANPRQILPKERIIEKIWGYDSNAEYNNIEVYISFLRKKLTVISAQVQIKTARGIGYSLE